jgi:hypothetical protein
MHLTARTGRLDGGRYLFASLNKGFKLNDRLSWGLSVERLSLDYPDDRDDLHVNQATISGVYDLTSEKGIVFRLIGNDQGGNAYAAYRQELRKGADAFLILGDPNSPTFQKRIGFKITNAY